MSPEKSAVRPRQAKPVVWTWQARFISTANPRGVLAAVKRGKQAMESIQQLLAGPTSLRSSACHW
jgi:hypothetical protein